MSRLQSWSLALLLGLLALAPEAPAVDGATVFLHANIHTMDPDRPRAEAMAVHNGRLLAVGSEAAAFAAAGPGAAVVDLAGATVLPGLIDAHGHMFSLGQLGTAWLDLTGVPTADEMVRRVARRAAGAPKGQWIVGRNWDHETWPDRALPTHHALSAATPDHPVLLQRVDGHAALANAVALAQAGISRDTPSPEGGEILRDSAGEPTGILVDNAQSLVRRIAAPPPVDPEVVLLEAQRRCLAVGLTGVHDMGVSPDVLEVYQRLDTRGDLRIRINAMIAGPYAARYFSQNAPSEGDRLTVRGAKLYMDGAMGSRGAWLLAPYADRPAGDDGKPYAGLAVTRPEDFLAAVEHAVARGYQVCTHAIGDRANREVLDAYRRALSSHADLDHRFRIEHAQLLDPADIARFAPLGVIASMQPTHCTTDMRWVEQRVGPDRARTAYAWASLLRSGAVIAGGSDFPVESHNPFYGLHAAITRQDADGEPAGGWNPQERMTRQEALHAFTLGAAHAGFREREVGSLEAGKWADFIVIDRDVMTCEPAQIRATRVLRTVIAGQTVLSAHRP